MAIRTNSYLNIITDPDTGEQRLFGKCGYQTMHPKLDRFTKANLAAIERALDAGELRDLDGNAVTDNAVIMVPMLVTKVKSEASMEQVASLRNADGTTANVPEFQPEADAADPDDIGF